MELWESRGPNAGMGGNDRPRDFQRPVGARLADLRSRRDAQRASTGRADPQRPVGHAQRSGFELTAFVGGRRYRTGIATLAHHLVDPRRAQPWVLRQGVADERQIRVYDAGPPHAGRDVWRLALDRGADCLTVEAELGRDGPDLPVLGVVQAPDLGALRGRDHPSSLSPRCAARASEPATGSSARRPRNAWQRGAEPGRRQGRGVWSIAALRGKTDPSRRGGGRGRRAAGRGGRDGPRDSADVAPWQPAPIGDGRPPGSAACSRHGRDHTLRRWRTGGCSIGRSSGVTAGPRRRSAWAKLRLDSAAPAVAQQR